MFNTHRDARHPFEIFLLAACAFAGITQALTGARPGSVASQLSPMMQLIWSALLGVGGVVALTGVFWHDIKVALELESIGLLAVAGACATYAGAVFIAAGIGGVASWAMTVAFAVCCLIRRRRIEKVLTPHTGRRWWQWGTRRK